MDDLEKDIAHAKDWLTEDCCKAPYERIVRLARLGAVVAKEPVIGIDADQTRDELARILETIAREGLDGPRDLDVALDAIESLYRDET